jgi:Holliday junction resolvasome RuvABC endonuclease subunit
MSMKTILKSNEELKPLRICSIDASTNSLAFAIFNDKELISTGKIKFNGKSNYEKVVDACKKLNAFFKVYNIVDAIVIEHTVFMNSPKVAADLALVQGAILGAAGINHIRVAGSVSPITWQIYIGNPKLTIAEKKELEAEYPGKTKAWYQNRSRDIRKIRTIQFVNTYYDKQIDDNDVADAVGIGHWAINNWGKLTK